MGEEPEDLDGCDEVRIHRSRVRGRDALFGHTLMTKPVLCPCMNLQYVCRWRWMESRLLVFRNSLILNVGGKQGKGASHTFKPSTQRQERETELDLGEHLCYGTITIFA